MILSRAFEDTPGSDRRGAGAPAIVLRPIGVGMRSDRRGARAPRILVASAAVPKRSHKSKTERVGRERRFLGALERIDPAVTLSIGRKPWTIADAAALVRERVDASMEVARAKAAWRHAIEKERGTLARTNDDLDAIRQLLTVAFRHDPATLAALGLAPRKKRRKPTGAEIVAMTAKMRATRAARGRGKKR